MIRDTLQIKKQTKRIWRWLFSMVCESAAECNSKQYIKAYFWVCVCVYKMILKFTKYIEMHNMILIHTLHFFSRRLEQLRNKHSIYIESFEIDFWCSVTVRLLPCSMQMLWKRYEYEQINEKNTCRRDKYAHDNGVRPKHIWNKFSSDGTSRPAQCYWQVQHEILSSTSTKLKSHLKDWLSKKGRKIFSHT